MKNKLTKVFALLFAAAMVLALTGCPDGIKDAAGTYTTQTSLKQILADGELKGIDLAKLTWKPVTEEVVSAFTKGLELELRSAKLFPKGEIANIDSENLKRGLQGVTYCIVNNKTNIIIVKVCRDEDVFWGLYQ